jgi:hypothetical protein
MSLYLFRSVVHYRFKKLEFSWFHNSQSLFNCRWCNETDKNCGYISASGPGLSQADGRRSTRHIGFYLRSSLWPALDVPYVRVFYLKLLPTVEQSGEPIPTGARFSALVQTDPGAYPASYTVGTGSFRGVKRRGVALTTHPHPAPKLKEYSYSSTPPPPPTRPSWPVVGWTLPFITSSHEQFVLMLVRKSKREVMVMVICTWVYYCVLRSFLDSKFLRSLRGFFEDRFYCP